ncbi:low molecular weight phosphatase family protein [Nonlabens antarcticus]|uniref:protein-tyrosine-phosphatase n=1 Tax=Nonlabens antarcticus TaxID=392714 RepID=UPI001891302F|nr:protein-tyrosine-phosphatase [Nonlabens antarcticus]
MFTPIKTYIEELNVSSVSESRKEVLNPLKDYISSKISSSQEIHLSFICTHNSRRSQLGQVWSQVMAAYFQVPNVMTYSGGTEATAVFVAIIDTLKKQHFQVELVDETDNPVYSVAYSEDDASYLFSKKVEDSSNPEEGFAAIMTCSQADEDCPVISGAEKRFSIPYEDPKTSDGTDSQHETYMQCSIQIAIEMKYVFSEMQA